VTCIASLAWQLHLLARIAISPYAKRE
jgi:hypothetical protein